MKAKRIAEIAHEMAQLSKEMDALSADLKDEYGKCAAHLIAKAIIENTLKATPFATAASSDRLRAELTANNIEMNRLTERNDAILSTLRGRGLAPVDREYHRKPKEFILQEPCNVSFNKVMSFKGYEHTPKLLTCEDLKLGGWFCRDVGNRSAVAFVEHGFDVCLFHEWGRSHESYAGCVLNLEDRKVTRVYTISDSCFEIVRFGNQFYRV